MGARISFAYEGGGSFRARPRVLGVPGQALWAPRRTVPFMRTGTMEGRLCVGYTLYVAENFVREAIVALLEEPVLSIYSEATIETMFNCCEAHKQNTLSVFLGKLSYKL